MIIKARNLPAPTVRLRLLLLVPLLLLLFVPRWVPFFPWLSNDPEGVVVVVDAPWVGVGGPAVAVLL